MQIYTASKVSVASNGGVTITEEYLPLWLADGTTVGTTSTSGTLSLIQDGAASVTSTNTGSQVKLHTLNSNWSSSQKFAFESTIYTSNASITCYAVLYDVTSATNVSASLISTTSTTATVIRSPQFTLTPGHNYGVFIYNNGSGTAVYLSDASLIVFG